MPNLGVMLTGFGIFKMSVNLQDLNLPFFNIHTFFSRLLQGFCCFRFVGLCIGSFLLYFLLLRRLPTYFYHGKSVYIFSMHHNCNSHFFDHANSFCF